MTPSVTEAPARAGRRELTQTDIQRSNPGEWKAVCDSSRGAAETRAVTAAAESTSSHTDGDGKTTHWWIVASGDRFEICDFDPGYEVVATLSGSLRTMVRVWRGEVPWHRALGSGELTIIGRADVERWIGTSVFAMPVPA